jgi:hypothetical protein
MVHYSELPDADLIVEVGRLAGSERRATGDVIRCLMEFDTRRLYLGEGYPSLFAYCTRVLNYSEHAALNRIEIARASRQYPRLLELVACGDIHLSGARLLVPHLTDENCSEVLGKASHKSKREIEAIVAGLHPLPAPASIIRRMPTGGTPADLPVDTPEQDATLAPAIGPMIRPLAAPAATLPATSAAARSAISPLAAERYKVQFTMSRETRDRLRRVQDLLRHVVPSGDPAVIFDRALTLLLTDLERARFAATAHPRPGRPASESSRRIPSAVRREVWQRDRGQCAFVGARGRCDERGWLEFHHVIPFAAGGPATTDNIELRCRAHNAFEATLYFGTPGEEVVRERAAAWG